MFRVLCVQTWGGGDTHWTTLVHRLGFIEAIVVSVGSDLYSPAKANEGESHT